MFEDPSHRRAVGLGVPLAFLGIAVALLATFWIGYLLHPVGRAFGMTVTVVPTLVLYVLLAHHALQ